MGVDTRMEKVGGYQVDKYDYEKVRCKTKNK